MVPALVIAVAFYATGIMPQPAIGSGEWWLTRLAWWGLLTVVLVALVAAINWAERPMLRLPTGAGPSGWWSPVLLVASTAVTMVGLARLAIAGFAPGGHLPALALSAYAAGLIGTLLTGRSPQPARPQALRPPVPSPPGPRPTAGPLRPDLHPRYLQPWIRIDHRPH